MNKIVPKNFTFRPPFVTVGVWTARSIDPYPRVAVLVLNISATALAVRFADGSVDVK